MAFQGVATFFLQVIHALTFTLLHPYRSVLKNRFTVALSWLEAMSYLSIALTAAIPDKALEEGGTWYAGGATMAVLKGLSVVCALSYAFATSGVFMLCANTSTALSHRVEKALKVSRHDTHARVHLEGRRHMDGASNRVAPDDRLESSRVEEGREEV